MRATALDSRNSGPHMAVMAAEVSLYSGLTSLPCLRLHTIRSASKIVGASYSLDCVPLPRFLTLRASLLVPQTVVLFGDWVSTGVIELTRGH